MVEDTQTLPTGTEIYDQIMSGIDRDLISASLENLEERHQARGESEEEKKIRHARYEKSFAEYDKQYAQFLVRLHEEVTHNKRNARAAAEMKERSEEEKKEEDLLSQISAI